MTFGGGGGILVSCHQRDCDGTSRRWRSGGRKAAKLFARGVSQADVARELDVSRQSVSRWHADFRRGGSAALRGAGRAGRKPKLAPSDLKSLRGRCFVELGRRAIPPICGHFLGSPR